MKNSRLTNSLTVSLTVNEHSLTPYIQHRGKRAEAHGPFTTNFTPYFTPHCSTLVVPRKHAGEWPPGSAHSVARARPRNPATPLPALVNLAGVCPATKMT
jgi:hypothetical protein